MHIDSDSLVVQVLAACQYKHVVKVNNIILQGEDPHIDLLLSEKILSKLLPALTDDNRYFSRFCYIEKFNASFLLYRLYFNNIAVQLSNLIALINELFEDDKGLQELDNKAKEQLQYAIKPRN